MSDMPTAKSPWRPASPFRAKVPPLPGPWAPPGAPGPWNLPGTPGPQGGPDPWGQRAPAPPPQEDLDPEIGLAAERQAAFAAQAKGFDFRGAIASSGRRSVFLILALTAAAAVIGGALSAGVVLGLLDGIRGGIDRNEAFWTAMGALGFAALSLLFAWFRLRGADAAILEEQGALEVLPDSPATRSDPLLRRLWNVTEEAALAAGHKMPRVFVLEDPAMNAFAVGVEPETSAVAATRGLLEALSREELAAVMAHEVAHLVQGDTRLMVTTAATAGLALGAIDVLARVRPRGRDGAAIYLLAIVVSLVVAAVVIPLLKMALSRQREYRADALAARLRRDPAALASALQRISGNPYVARADHETADLYIVSPFAPSKMESLLATHPPIERRIARLLDLRAD